MKPSLRIVAKTMMPTMKQAPKLKNRVTLQLQLIQQIDGLPLNRLLTSPYEQPRN